MFSVHCSFFLFMKTENRTHFCSQTGLKVQRGLHLFSFREGKRIYEVDGQEVQMEHSSFSSLFRAWFYYWFLVLISTEVKRRRKWKSKKMAAKQMEEIQKKLGMLNYPRANAPAQSLLFAGMERYALLEWLFFRYLPPLSQLCLVYLFLYLVLDFFIFQLQLCSDWLLQNAGKEKEKNGFESHMFHYLEQLEKLKLLSTDVTNTLF